MSYPPQGTGTGDMQKTVYDQDENSIVDSAEIGKKLKQTKDPAEPIGDIYIDPLDGKVYVKTA